MADSTRYGNAVDFDVDLHSVYAAYLGQFESAGTDWWDRSWGGYFGTFNDFLSFGWEVMVVVDSATGRAHIAVRPEQVALFAKMIKNRFGESLSKLPPTTLPLSPVPTRTLSLRRLLILSDLPAFRKLALSLPSAELSNLRSRARSGDVGLAEQLFYAGGPAGEREKGNVGVRDNGMGYTWACVKTTWWEKGGSAGGIIPGQGRVQGGREGGQVVGSDKVGNVNAGGQGPGQGAVQKGKTGGLVLEVGMAVMRCAHLRAVDVWPPVPQENYRKSHYIIEEWVDKRTNSHPPSYPRAYAFGKSQWIPEKSLERIMDANLAALSSQENDATPNTLILLTVGEPSPIPLPTWSTLPTNIIHLDVLALEHKLLRRAQEAEIPGTPDRQTPLPSLAALLQTLQIPVPPFVPLGNAGNEAYYTLLAFQKLMMAETRLPDLLFQQPDFGYMGQMGQQMQGMMGSLGMGNGNGMGYNLPGSGSMVFNGPGGMNGMSGMNGMNSMASMGSMNNLANHTQNFSPLPPPQAPFAQYSQSRSHSHSHSRRGSSSSPRHSSEIMPPPSIPTSRSGTHSGSRSPSDNSPRRQHGTLPPNVRRQSGSYQSISGSGTKQRPASVPHHGSFEAAVGDRPVTMIGINGERQAQAQAQAQAPLRSAMRGSGSNVNIAGQVNGGSGLSAHGSNSATASRTVSWSGPPPIDVDTPGGVFEGDRPAVMRTGSLPDGYETPEYMAAAARSPVARETTNGIPPIQTSGYVNGHGNSYTRSPVMLSSTRSRSSDYFGGQQVAGLGTGASGRSGSVINFDEAAQVSSGPSSPQQMPRAVRRASQVMMLEQSTGSLGSGGGGGGGIGSGQASVAGTNVGTAPGSTATSVSAPASTSTGNTPSLPRGLSMSMSGPDVNGSGASASGSGGASVPGSGPSAGSGSGSGSAQSHPTTQSSGGNASGNGNIRTLSRSNLSAMLTGGLPKTEKEEKPAAATRKQSKDMLKEAKSGKDAKDGKVGKEGKEGRLKSEKSMKNVAGALARFWVG